MLTSLKEIAELMRSNLFQLDNEIEKDLKKAGIISKYQEDLLHDLENAISLIEKLEKANLFITKPVIKKSKLITCENCNFTSTDERRFSYNNLTLCSSCEDIE